MIGFKASWYDELSATLPRKKTHDNSYHVKKLIPQNSPPWEAPLLGRLKGIVKGNDEWVRHVLQHLGSIQVHPIAVHRPFANGFEDLGCRSCILMFRLGPTWMANSRKLPLKSALATQCWPTRTASKGHSSPSWYAQLDCLNCMHRNRARVRWTRQHFDTKHLITRHNKT